MASMIGSDLETRIHDASSYSASSYSASSYSAGSSHENGFGFTGFRVV